MSCFAGRQNSVVIRPTEMGLGFVVESWAWEDHGGQDPLTYTISVPYPAKRVEVGILVRRLTVPYVVVAMVCTSHPTLQPVRTL